MLEDLAGIFAVVLSLGIPVVAIVCGTISSIKKREKEKEIRQLIIENNTDLEVAKQLIEEPERKGNKYSALRWACILIGLGLAALVNSVLNLTTQHDIYFWCILAFGVGVGLLVSFIVEFKLQRKAEERAQANNQE